VTPSETREKRARRREPSSVNDLCYQRPDPVKVAKIFDSPAYGRAAAFERWSWLSHGAVEKIAQEGREILRGKAGGPIQRGPRRRTTPEQEEAAIAKVFELGGVGRASKATGLTYTFILTLLRERGITDYPKVPGSERGRLAAEGRARKAAAIFEGKPYDRYANVVKLVVAPRADRKVPPDETIIADSQKGLSTKEMAAAYGVTYPTVYATLLRLKLPTSHRKPKPLPSLKGEPADMSKKEWWKVAPTNKPVVEPVEAIETPPEPAHADPIPKPVAEEPAVMSDPVPATAHEAPRLQPGELKPGSNTGSAIHLDDDLKRLLLIARLMSAIDLDADSAAAIVHADRRAA
jgi:hypothetical protein